MLSIFLEQKIHISESIIEFKQKLYFFLACKFCLDDAEIFARLVYEESMKLFHGRSLMPNRNFIRNPELFIGKCSRKKALAEIKYIK